MTRVLRNNPDGTSSELYLPDARRGWLKDMGHPTGSWSLGRFWRQLRRRRSALPRPSLKLVERMRTMIARWDEIGASARMCSSLQAAGAIDASYAEKVSKAAHEEFEDALNLAIVEWEKTYPGETAREGGAA